MISDCAVQYPVGNCIERRDIKRIFLPAECGYIDQRRPGWNGLSDEAIPVRRLFSKQEDKKATKESAKEFIGRFTFPVKVNLYCYNFLDDQHLVKLQGFQAFENANSEHFKYKSPDLAVWASGYNKVYIRMRYTKPLYQYLVLKSYRNALSYDPLHSLAMPNMTSEQY